MSVNRKVTVPVGRPGRPGPPAGPGGGPRRPPPPAPSQLQPHPEQRRRQAQQRDQAPQEPGGRVKLPSRPDPLGGGYGDGDDAAEQCDGDDATVLAEIGWTAVAREWFTRAWWIHQAASLPAAPVA